METSRILMPATATSSKEPGSMDHLIAEEKSSLLKIFTGCEFSTGNCSVNILLKSSD